MALEGTAALGTLTFLREQPSKTVGSDAALEVTDIVVHFGGIRALDSTNLAVGPREIVGLIGPNGAGKTTLMNVVSGLIRPEAGSIRVFGFELVAHSPQRRAQLGVARSFQDAALFSGLTVLETVQLAVGRTSNTYLLPAMLSSPGTRNTERSKRERALELIDAFGLGPWAHRLTMELSTGMRRICDLVVQVATEPRLLLLDEPTAGVAQREAEMFGPLIRNIHQLLGCSVLVIEHDMPLLMGLCDRVCALDSGRVICSGTPQEVREDPAVMASYLGTDPTAVERSNRQTSTAISQI